MSPQDTILAITALSGEMSPDAIARVVPNIRYRYTIVEQLQQAKLIRPYTKEKVKGYRLTAKGKRKLCEENYNRYIHALQGSVHTNHVPSELPRRLRLQRISETLAMMMDCGVQLFPDRKVNLFMSGCRVTEPVPLPAFYLTKEIHELGDATIKIKNARSTGVLVAQAGYYLVYNTGSAVMRWASVSEQKISFMISEHFQYQLQWDRYISTKVRGLMLGKDMAVAEQLLNSRGGYKDQYFQVKNCVFEHLHYLPNTPEGSTLLRLLLNPDAAARLTKDLAEAFGPKTMGDNFDYDATSDTDTAVLFAWDFDLVRIRNFHIGISNRKLSGIVMAFDFQIEVLEHYLGASATVHPMSLEKTRRLLLET